MYESPIELILTKPVYASFRDKEENEIFRAVQNVGISVDKEELLKALRYDRGQYEKGYLEGVTQASAVWIPVRERLPVIKEGHTRTGDIVVWLEGAGLAIARRCEYHTARNWTWNSRRVTHWLSVSPPADDEPDPDRKTAYGDRLEASFHGESWSKCRLCGKTYEAHSLIRGKKQDEYYCPYCFGYGKVEA